MRSGHAHTAPRPRAHCAVSWHAGCRIAGPAPVVSQAPSTVSWLCRCAHARAGPTVSWHTRRRVVACLATRPAAKPPSYHDTIVCIVTRLANQTARLSRYKDCIVTQPLEARPLLLSRYKTLYRDTHPQPGHLRSSCRPYRAHCALYCGACSAVSWPSPGRIMAYPLRAHACCVTIHSTIS